MSQRTPIEVEVNGKTYSAYYEVTGKGSGELVTVHTDHGHKSTQVGGTPPAVLAKMMLREMRNSGCPQPACYT